MSSVPPPRFDPARYPGPRPTGPVLVRDGAVSPLAVEWPGELATPVELHYSVAYGSNACVDRIVDKGLDRAGAVLLPARMRGWSPAFAARWTRYGSVPLVLVHDDADRELDTWVLGVATDALDLLDRTEGRARVVEDQAGGAGSGYVLGRVGPVAVADRYLLPDALAYLPAPGTRLLAGPEGSLTWPEHDQATAARALADGGPTLAASPPTRVIEGSWPTTPLIDLPLLVYGTLRPDGAAWPLVADLVEVVGEATARGVLYATPHGWPAADLTDTGRVRGVLLYPRSPQAAAELVARVDAYEGAPRLFHRRAVVAARPDGTWTWALAYHWPDGRPPGRPLPDGLWRP